MDERYNRVSTIITTNLEPHDWYELFQKKPLVDALLDRLQHHCITIRINGPSLRTQDVPPSVQPKPILPPSSNRSHHRAVDTVRRIPEVQS
jgi:hypothetical protein